MTLFNELQERWKAIFLEREIVEKRADELAEDMQELEVALKALHELHAPIADEQPELIDEPQEIEASSQSESCVPALGAETDLQTSPGEAEESRDQFEEEAERAAAIELTADVEPMLEPQEPYPDAEPIPEPEWNEPQPTEQNDYDTTGVLTADDMQAVAMPNYAEYPAPVTDGYAPVTDAWVETIPGTLAEYLPTNPAADEAARAHDYYSPENVEKRNRFNPWGGVAHLFGKSKVDA